MILQENLRLVSVKWGEVHGTYPDEMKVEEIDEERGQLFLLEAKTQETPTGPEYKLTELNINKGVCAKHKPPS